MDKKKKQLILIAILVPILIYLVINSISEISDRRRPARPRPAEPDEVPEVAPAIPEVALEAPPSVPVPVRPELDSVDEEILERQEAIAGGDWGRDPFRPPEVIESERPFRDYRSFRLSGTIAGRMAIIDGEAIVVGEEYRGYRLKQAEHYRIILEKDNQTFTLNISEE